MKDEIKNVVGDMLTEERPVAADTPPITQEPQSPLPEEPIFGKERDSAGVYYDPAIHSRGKVKNKDGTWRTRKTRTVKAPPTEPSYRPESPPPPDRENVVVLDEHRLLARQLVAMLSSTMIIVCGDKFDPDNEQQLIELWSQFFAEVGWIRLPAWLLAPLMTGFISFMHINSSPERQAKAAEVWRKMRGKNAPVNPGTNRERQNNPGIVAGGGANPPGPDGSDVDSVPAGTTMPRSNYDIPRG